jgi:hypothetical protein
MPPFISSDSDIITKKVEKESKKAGRHKAPCLYKRTFTTNHVAGTSSANE